MNAEGNMQRVQGFYELLLSNFEEARKRYIADDFVWENPLPEIVPFGGRYEGSDGLLRYLAELDRAIEMSPLHITDLVGDGPVVAAVGVEENTRVKSTGKRYTMPFVHVLRFNDEGMICHVREYNDTREMLAAFVA